MIIYTNEGNPLGLKLLISAILGNKAVTVKFISLNDSTVGDLKHLPYLKLDSGTQIFSTDSAIKYLHPPADDNIKDSWQQWIEWSTTKLAPAITQYLESKVNVGIREIVDRYLKQLNDTLTKSIYITGAKLTSADIAIWCLLAAANKILQHTSDIESLLIWHKTISEMPQVKVALASFPLEKLNFSSLQQANKFGGLSHISLSKTIDDNNEQQSDSPNNAATAGEVVTTEELDAAKNSFIYSAPESFSHASPILPIPGKRNVLITSALPYVNNVPHLGNIIGCVLSADIFARYCRTAGYNTLYIGGTDEYGTATENKALAENLTPQQICDKYFVIHDEIYKWFCIEFDYFGRTTTPEQTKNVQMLFNECLKNDYLFTQSVDQLLCQKCDRYLADRFVEGTCPHPGCGYEDARGDQCDGCSKLVNATELINPRCNTCRTAPVIRQSSQFFLDLPKIEPKLRAYLETKDNLWSNNARVITKSWLREGLKPRCITRDLKWGIPVPYKGFENKVFYVWFDAPIGYMSITNTYTEKWEEWWRPTNKNVNIELFQFMAKDNVPFHSVMFPSTLLAADKGYTLVSNIMATEYLNYEDGKFSKSRGTGVFGNDAKDTGIPSDVWRFYLASSRPEGQDSNFNWTELITRNNSELLNNLGNFINRSLVFCEKNFHSIIPTIQLNDDDLNLLALINREIFEYIRSMERAKYRDGIKHTLTVSRLGNQYMQIQQPWVMLKGETDDEKNRAASVIGLCCNIVCLLANLLSPFMPNTSATIYNQLNTVPQHLNVEKPNITQFFASGHKIGKPIPLFAKIESTKADEFKKTYGGAQVQAVKSDVTAEKLIFTTIADAEAAIAKQGEKVRVAKASGVEKSVWQLDVAVLLDYKKQLTALQKSNESQPVKPKVDSNAVKLEFQTVAEAEAAVAAQGEKVRVAKASGVGKSIWQVDVTVLLDYKKQLAALQQKQQSAGDVVQKNEKPTPILKDIKEVTTPAASNGSSIAELEDRITKQGEKVRQLKSSSTDKSVWTPEVNFLLALKKELTALTGTAVPAAPVSSGKTGKNKKKK